MEIDAKCAREMVGKGSKLIWVLDAMDARRHAALQEMGPDIYSIDFNSIMSSSKPKELVGNSPVLVCEHGITSLLLAQKLRKDGIEAFSVEVGVDGMLKG